MYSAVQRLILAGADSIRMNSKNLSNKSPKEENKLDNPRGYNHNYPARM
jgi:hypothetical protein